MNRSSRRWSVAAALVALGTVSACSTTEGSSAPGVDDDTIHLGVLTDLSGPFSVSGKVQVSAQRAYWAAQNAEGGVCGREVQLNIQDHGYDPQRASSQYRELESSTLAIEQILGTPIVQAVLPRIDSDSVLTGGVGWASVALGHDSAMMPGAPYPVDVANAVDYMVTELGVEKGSTIGAIFLQGDVAADARKGLDAAATAHELDVVDREITPADTDLSSQVAALAQAGVSGVLVSTSPGQFGSVVNQVRSRGLDVPIIAQQFSWHPSTLDGLAGDALSEDVYVIGSVAPYASEESGPSRAVELYEEDVPDGAEDWGAVLGYGTADLMRQVLAQTCDGDGDLTRENLIETLRSLDSVDTDGVFPPGLDFSDPTAAPSLSNFVMVVAADEPGGLRLVEEFEGPSAASIAFGDE